MGTGEWSIRDFRDDDYDSLAAVDSEIYPDLPQTAEEFREADAGRDPRCRWRRWVVEIGDKVIGYGYYTQYISKYAPGRYHIGGGVSESYHHLGIGAALYHRVMAGLGTLQPKQIRAHARADRTVAVEFLLKRGFREYRREGDSMLDVAEFDSKPYEGISDRLRRQGIEIKTLRELEDDPDRDRKLYDLDWEVTRDEPGSEDDTRVDFDTFVREGVNAAHRLPDGYFVAVVANEYVGVCLLNAILASGMVKHGITGVTRGYRRRGIATAMKVRAVEYARATGIPRIYTDNEIGNRPMLAINERLGFVRLPDWVFFDKEIEDR